MPGKLKLFTFFIFETINTLKRLRMVLTVEWNVRATMARTIREAFKKGVQKESKQQQKTFEVIKMPLRKEFRVYNKVIKENWPLS